MFVHASDLPKGKGSRHFMANTWKARMRLLLTHFRGCRWGRRRSILHKRQNYIRGYRTL